MSFLDLITPETTSEIRDKIRGYAISAGLKITNWRLGGVGQQLLEMNTAMTDAYVRMRAKITRGYASLDTSVDPGDVDPYDPENETLDQTAGHLSAFGANTFDTIRIDKTFATGSITFVNAGTVARTIAPYGLTFTWTVSPPAGTEAPTYRNVEDATVYAEPGGVITIPAGASLDLPVQCDVAGNIGSCPSSSVSLTTSLLGCTATNDEPISGNDREDAETYRQRCRKAVARLSLGGPADIYSYLANTQIDGTPLYNEASPPAQVGITRVEASTSSATGTVTVYYASASGAPIAEDVTAANANIELYATAVGDTITFLGSGALASTRTVAGTVKIKNRAGLDVVTIKTAIVTALAEYWKTIPIGGYDNSGSSGTIYLNDIESIVKSAYPGLYGVVLSAPTTNTSLSTGYVSVLDSEAADWTVTVVS